MPMINYGNTLHIAMSISLSVWNPRRSIINNHVSATSRKRSVRMQRDLIDHASPRKSSTVLCSSIQYCNNAPSSYFCHDMSDLDIRSRKMKRGSVVFSVCNLGLGHFANAS
ncbi:unnamed protein product [Fusarium graminearum]|uniref:Uncharacterized protein n=1 Tax=Gibberella zeae TaxID=5518 RepID=A0A4E9EAH2_GIBZA|nr:unnamed protein product [Fusarium graminearum]CAF3585629.1 unnamed protein product [Fusarium graminearum]CAG2005388.1 unnamed protein product [Fusarium graminearum]CAG2012083.1 unnamed protein product [Fusarium graminearum]